MTVFHYCIVGSPHSCHKSHHSSCSPPLSQSYEPKYYYMEVVLLVYRLIMSAAVVLFMPDTLAQVMCTSCASARIELSNQTFGVYVAMQLGLNP